VAFRLDACRNSSRWNAEKARTLYTESLHHEADDIWTRYGRLNDLAVAANEPLPPATTVFSTQARHLPWFLRCAYFHVRKRLIGLLRTADQAPGLT